MAVSACLPAEEMKTRGDSGYRYRLQPFDVIDVAYRLTPEFNQTATIQPDGFVTLPAAGEVKIQGLTVAEATRAIVKACQGVLREPIVSLTIKSMNGPFFYVNGHVAKPGRFDLRSETTVSDAIAMAGGFNPGAKESEVYLLRRVSKDVAEVERIDVQSVFALRPRREDVPLQPGDSIFVTKSAIGKIDRFMQVARLGMYFNPLPFKY